MTPSQLSDQSMYSRGQVLTRDFNTGIALNATVLALEGVPNLGPVNSGIRLPEHHATSPDTSRPETEDALETFEQSPNAEWVFSCSV